MHSVRRLVPIVTVIALLAVIVPIVILQKKGHTTPQAWDLGAVLPEHPCAHSPKFLLRLHIPQPVMIDLSQKRYTGLALRYGKRFSRTLHPKQWEQYAHFSTYALDKSGNMYLIPTPFISINPTTFTLQKKLFRLDTQTGKIAIFMTLDDVHPRPENPYGLSAIALDCDDGTLWIAAIDESDYRHQRGVLYHIDPDRKRILQTVQGFDALTLKIVHTSRGKYLLAGSARDNGLYAFAVGKQGHLSATPKRIVSLPDANQHIRKIRIPSRNVLALESIPFTYSLIAQSDRQDRLHYQAHWYPEHAIWRVSKLTP